MSEPIASYQRSKLGLSVVAAVFSALITLLFGYLSVRSRPITRGEVVVQIVDAVSNSPIPTSSVQLEYGNASQSLNADNAGRVAFTIPSKLLGTVGTLRAEAAGFSSVTKPIVLGKDDLIVLVPLRNGSVSTEPALTPYTQVFRSGSRPSGIGSDFSAWYELAAAPPKPGFVIDQKSSSFALTGDRTCNAWSQCIVFEQTDTALVWRFRMQGHNETPFTNQGVTYSEAILKVTYVPKGP